MREYKFSLPSSIFKKVSERTEQEVRSVWAENLKKAKQLLALELGMGKLPWGTRYIPQYRSVSY